MVKNKIKLKISNLRKKKLFLGKKKILHLKEKERLFSINRKVKVNFSVLRINKSLFRRARKRKIFRKKFLSTRFLRRLNSKVISLKVNPSLKFFLNVNVIKLRKRRRLKFIKKFIIIHKRKCIKITGQIANLIRFVSFDSSRRFSNKYKIFNENYNIVYSQFRKQLNSLFLTIRDNQTLLLNKNLITYVLYLYLGIYCEHFICMCNYLVGFYQVIYLFEHLAIREEINNEKHIIKN